MPQAPRDRGPPAPGPADPSAKTFSENPTVQPGPAPDPGARRRTLGARASIVSPPGAAPRSRPATPGPAAGGGAEFRVLKLIGKGGMGVVYAARQGSLVREVALKMVLDDVPDAGRAEA